jgi:hypothetical protein
MITSGGCPMTSEERLVFRADGSYARGSGRAVAGGSSWFYDGGSGGPGEQGRWTACWRAWRDHGGGSAGTA